MDDKMVAAGILILSGGILITTPSSGQSLVLAAIAGSSGAYILGTVIYR